MLRASNSAVEIVGARGARGGSRENAIAMKRNMVPLLGIAFVVAIISTGIFYGLFAGKLHSSADIPGHSVVVAARDLERGTVIQASDLRISEAPGILSGSFSKLDDAVGATLLTPLKTNEPLLAERVVSRAPAAGGSSKRWSKQWNGAFGNAGHLHPGFRVGWFGEFAAAGSARGSAGGFGSRPQPR